jgi:hypothetical protein
MSTQVTLNVYLQALGGKFLGPNAYQTDNIDITLSYSEGVVQLPYQLGSNTDDGNIGAFFTPGSSSCMPILQMNDSDTPIVNYLTTDANTIYGSAAILISGEETANLTAIIPKPDGQTLTISQSILLSPLQDLYEVSLTVPGLLLLPDPQSGLLAVFVEMMCGCKITQGTPKSFWPHDDFEVWAVLTLANEETLQVPLQFDLASNNSLFTAPILPDQQAEIVQLTYYAKQKSTGNYAFVVG